MVDLGVARSGEQARELISGGHVLVAGSVALKPSRMLALDEPVIVTTAINDGYVSRGGIKLHAALGRFGLDASGLRCLDAGASTGGFTDCLLKHGAGEVVAVDVGSGQLHERVRDDPRVQVLDRTNIRSLDLEAVHGRPFDMVVADLSFISLRLLVPVFTGELVRGGSCLLLLVKPQFEAGKKIVSQGKGIVRDVRVHEEVLVQVAGEYAAAGARVCNMMPSPIRGAKGNVEYFIYHRIDLDGATEGVRRSDAVQSSAHPPMVGPAVGARVTSIMPPISPSASHGGDTAATPGNLPDCSGGLPLRECAARAVAEATDRWPA
ncbi:MAG: TlyA family RNA methyltransferase [Actinobacteria bacterium]|nr:TlyA family RNA methyltransferase [Actinomycetota bacterium]